MLMVSSVISPFNTNALPSNGSCVVQNCTISTFLSSDKDDFYRFPIQSGINKLTDLHWNETLAANKLTDFHKLYKLFFLWWTYLYSVEVVFFFGKTYRSLGNHNDLRKQVKERYYHLMLPCNGVKAEC